MGNTELFANLAQTTVTAGGSTAPASGTSESWTVANPTGFPVASPVTTPPSQFRIEDPAVPGEIVIVTDSRSATWSVTRGAEGTTPVAHSSNFAVEHVITSGTLGQFLQQALLTTQGDLLYQGSSAALRLPVGIPGTTLGANPAGTAPAWQGAPGLMPSGDVTGATDTASINGLLTLSGTCQLGPGTFYVGGSAAIAVAANQTVKGYGPQATVITIPAGFTGSSVFSTSASGYSQISDLSVVGASSAITSNPQCDAIVLNGGRFNRLDNLFFQYVNGWCVSSSATTTGGVTSVGYATMLTRISVLQCAGGISITGIAAGNNGAQHFIIGYNAQQVGVATGGAANRDCLRVTDANDITCTNTNFGVAGGLGAPGSSPLPATGPVLTAGTGGTLAAGTYQVEATYVNCAGETTASISSSITIAANATIIVTAPGSSGNATGWRAYFTQAGGSAYTLQGGTNGTSTNFTLSAPPSSGGANPPGTNTTGTSGAAVNITGKCSTGQYNVCDWGSYPNYPGQSAVVLLIQDDGNGSPTDQRFSTGCVQQGQNGVLVTGGANKLDFTDFRVFNNWGSGSKFTGTGDTILFNGCQWASNGQAGPYTSATYYDHEVTGTATGKTVSSRYNSPVVAAGIVGVANVVSLPSSGYNWNHWLCEFTGSGTPATPFTHAPGVYLRGDTSPSSWNGRLTVQSGQSAGNFGFASINTGSGPTVPFNKWQAAAAGDLVHGVYVAGDTAPRFQQDSNGKTWAGPGGSTAVDTVLWYRLAAASVKTDSALTVAGALTASGGAAVSNGLSVSGAFTSAAASVSSQPNAPASTTSTTMVMMGLGTSATGTAWSITPGSSGKVKVEVTGYGNTATAATTFTVGPRYGTGTAPSNAATLQGTRWGTAGDITTKGNGISIDAFFGFTVILTLVVGTTYWFDLGLNTGNVADAATVHNLSFTAYEIQ